MSASKSHNGLQSDIARCLRSANNGHSGIPAIRKACANLSISCALRNGALSLNSRNSLGRVQLHQARTDLSCFLNPSRHGMTCHQDTLCSSNNLVAAGQQLPPTSRHPHCGQRKNEHKPARYGQ